MKNAYEEIIDVLESKGKTIKNIKCIRVYFESKKIYDLADLHFDYDGGYNGDYYDGYILLDDNDWLERVEYDAVSWWEYKKYPQWLEDLESWLKQ